jgi:hypothetical protein
MILKKQKVGSGTSEEAALFKFSADLCGVIDHVLHSKRQAELQIFRYLACCRAHYL